jgi:hypothetical protein
MNYTYEVDSVNKSEWTDLLLQFDDASIYQTWEYGSVFFGEKNISHFILKRDTIPVAITQVRIYSFPLKIGGLAYIRWGPLWKLKNSEYDVHIFKNCINALHKEYVIKRKLALKIFPRIYNQDTIAQEICTVFKEESFTHIVHNSGTMLYPLHFSIEKLRKGLDRRWRQNLIKSEANNLNFQIGTEETLFNNAFIIYKQLLERKKFEPFIDIKQFFQLQNVLPEIYKLKVLICFNNQEKIAFILWSDIGDCAVALFAGTSRKALNTYASFFSWWKLIEFLKEKGLKYFDLGGINPQRNPGSYQFKAGICKNIGKEVSYIGEFNASDDFISALFMNIIQFGKKVDLKLNFFLEKIKKSNLKDSF